MGLPSLQSLPPALLRDACGQLLDEALARAEAVERLPAEEQRQEARQQAHPQHHRGVTQVPGVSFLGLPWLSRRGSSFIWGVWHDAEYLAGHIATRR